MGVISKNHQFRKMPKICVQSPEVVSQGAINIHAQVSVVTKAKLDEISVKGNCECGEKPLVELVIVIDGSDSYNNKVGGDEGAAFDSTLTWVCDLVDDIKDVDRTSVSVVQFSGNKQLAASYKPGSLGKTSVAEIEHFKIEVPSTKLSKKSDIKNKVMDCKGLDGNGQLYLCIQDLSMKQYTDDLSVHTLKKNQDRQRVMIVVTDEEWDIHKLQDGFGGGLTDPKKVCQNLHKAYDRVYPCILRRDRYKKMNEDHIKNDLAKGSVQDMYTDDWDRTSTAARKNIIADLNL